MGNYKCKKCKRFVRTEEQTSEMKAEKKCSMCILDGKMKKNYSIFDTRRDY